MQANCSMHYLLPYLRMLYNTPTNPCSGDPSGQQAWLLSPTKSCALYTDVVRLPKLQFAAMASAVRRSNVKSQQEKRRLNKPSEGQAGSDMQSAADLTVTVVSSAEKAMSSSYGCAPVGHSPLGQLETHTAVLECACASDLPMPQLAGLGEYSETTDTQAPAAGAAQAALQLAGLPSIAGELPHQRSAMQGILACDKVLATAVETYQHTVGTPQLQTEAEPASVARDHLVQQIEPAWPALATQHVSEVDAGHDELQPAPASKTGVQVVLDDSQLGRNSWIPARRVVHANGRRKQRWVRSGRHWKCLIRSS